MARQSTNPWARYMARIGGKNYVGSSGYWANQATPFSPLNQSREGYGYPGDAAKAAIAAQEGVQLPPGSPYAMPSRYPGTGVGGTRTGSASLYAPLEILKSPSTAGAARSLWGQYGQDLPDFNQLLNDVKGAQTGVKRAYANEQAAYNIGPYAATQRGLDYNLTGETGRYAGTARDIGSRYAASEDRYAGQVGDVTQRAYDILPEYDRAAQAIGDRQIAELRGNISKYKIAGGNLGLGSDELRMLARGVADVSLPLEREKIQRRYDVLTGVELPGQREIASRYAQRLTQFEQPVERDIYAQQYQNVMQQKKTESDIKQLEMATAGMSRQAAESYLRSLAIAPEIISTVLQRKNAVLSGQIANAAGIGALENEAYYRDLEYLPGANLNQPQYYNMSLPGYPGYAPNRYGTVTGNEYAPQGMPTATGNYANNPLASRYASANPVDIGYFNTTGQWPMGDPNFSVANYQGIFNAQGARLPSRYSPQYSAAVEQEYT